MSVAKKSYRRVRHKLEIDRASYLTKWTKQELDLKKKRKI